MILSVNLSSCCRTDVKLGEISGKTLSKAHQDSGD
jgi:hypothetical protein